MKTQTDLKEKVGAILNLPVAEMSLDEHNEPFAVEESEGPPLKTTDILFLTTFEDPKDKFGTKKAANEKIFQWLTTPVATREDRTFPKAALQMVNYVRGRLGLDPLYKLLPGKQGNASSCVIALSILFGYDGSKGKVSVGGGSTHVGSKKYKHPPEVATFIGKFDGGEYERLIKGKMN